MIKILIPTLVIFCNTILAGNIEFKRVNEKPIQYELIEWNIELIAEYENPYLYTDISLDMKLYSPSGKELILPCYFISGKSGEKSLWKARFAAKEIGKYKYYYVLSKSGEIISESKEDYFEVNKSDKKGFLQPNNLWSFKYDNGEIFRGIGENIGWEARIEDDSKYFKELHENPRFNYDFMLKKLGNLGGNYFRTWMCSWNLPLEWKYPSNSNKYEISNEHFNPTAIKRIDWLVQLCDSLNIHFMLALDSHVSLMGSGWEKNNYNSKNGGYADSIKEFFSNKFSKEQYKSRLRYLVARWGFSPSIGAWEFFNEIDNAVFAGKDKPIVELKSVVEWHKEMSEYLNLIDPYNHIITTSISHRDIEGLNDIQNIDLNQKHIYVNIDAIPSTIIGYSKKHSKPYIIGEFAHHWDWSLDFNLYRNEFDFAFKKGLWLGLFSQTPILPMAWWWEYFDENKTTNYLPSVRYILNKMNDESKGNFESIEVNTNDSLLTKAVKAGETIFIFILNQSKNSVKNPILNFNSATLKEYKQVQVFEPENNSFEEGAKIFFNSSQQINFNNVTMKSNSMKIIIIK